MLKKCVLTLSGPPYGWGYVWCPWGQGEDSGGLSGFPCIPGLFDPVYIIQVRVFLTPTPLRGACVCVSVHDAQLMPSGCTDTFRPALSMSSPADERLGRPPDTTGTQVPSVFERAHSCCRGQAGQGPHQGRRMRSSSQNRGDYGGAWPCTLAGRAPGARGRETGQEQWSLRSD